MHVCLNCVEIFSWGKYGGYGRTTRELGRRLVKAGVEVTAVVPRRNEQTSVEMLDGIRVLGFPMKAPWQAQSLFESCNADIVHSQEPSMATYFAMKALPNARHVVTIRDPKFLRDWLVEVRYPSVSLPRTFLSRFYDVNFLVRSSVRQADAVLSAGLQALDRDTRPRMPGERALWLYKRGLARFGRDRRLEATADFQDALRNTPADWVRGRTLLTMGKIADLNGQRADAVANYRTAREVGTLAKDTAGAAEATRLLSRPFSRPKN